jgi:hypothetical protein
MAKNFHVTLSESALRSITLATAESYAFGDGRRKKRTDMSGKSVETFGYLWGYQKATSGDLVQIHVDVVSVSISAEREANSVNPNVSAMELKAAIMERWHPHMQLLGNFHSHPYESYQEVKDTKGFEFSPADLSSHENDVELWDHCSDYPLMLVMTICKMSKVHDRYGVENIRDNIGCFDVGEFRFWLNASVGIEEDGIRMCTPNTRSPVVLSLDGKFFNSSGDRLLENYD